MSNNMKRISIYSLTILFVYLFVFCYSFITNATREVKSPTPAGIDFAFYYTAGQLVMTGHTEDLYEHNIFHTEFSKVLGCEAPRILGWPYPPTFFLFIIPFSFFPYYIALLLWVLTTLALAIFAAYLLIPQYKTLVLLVCGFPGVLMNLRWGQNAFLNTALLGFGLYFLDRRPILAGLMFGLLTYKPQMAFFPLLLLLITKKWKVLTWSIVFSISTALLSATLFGLSAWYNFINTFLNSSTTLLISAWEQLSGVQPTFYSVFRIMGIERQTLILLLSIIAIIVTIVSAWVWRNTDRLTLRGAVLVLGILLTMPYYMQYDLMILSIPLILLSYDCKKYGYRLYEIAILASLWFMPLINWPLVFFTRVQICPFVLLAVFVMIIIRVLNDNRTDKTFSEALL